MIVHEEIAELIGEYAALSERTRAVVSELGADHWKFVDYLSTMLIYELALLKAKSAMTPPAQSPPAPQQPQQFGGRPCAEVRQRQGKARSYARGGRTWR